MLTLNSFHVALGETSILHGPGSPGILKLRTPAGDLTIGKRSMEGIRSLTGVGAARISHLAKDQPVELGRFVRHPESRSLWITSAADGHAVVISPEPPKPIDRDSVVAYLANAGFSMPEHGMSDGRMQVHRLTSDHFVIGADTYRSGLAVDIDFAGYQRPKTSFYLERQVCMNGQMITIATEHRSIPQHTLNAELNADTLTEHVDDWSKQHEAGVDLERMTIAATTTASFREVLSLNTLARSPDINGLRRPKSLSRRRIATIIDTSIEAMLGDWRSLTGVADLGEIPKRELRYLPSATSVAGVINLATECASHYVARNDGNLALVRWWNHLLQGRFDLEGVKAFRGQLPARWISEPAAIVASTMN